MIKYKSNKGEVELDINGSLPMICAESVQMFTAIYKALFDKNPVLAKAYRYVVTKSIEEGMPFEIGDLIEENPTEDIKEIIERVFKGGL